MRFKRRSRAAWQGSVDEGQGTLSLGSGAFEGRYSVRSRTEDGNPDTNPEELIAAAHAGCFTMSLSNELTEAGTPPAQLDTTATVYLERRDEGFVIPQIDLEVTGQVPGIDAATFERLADEAMRNCTVSKVLAAAEITLRATLASDGKE
jgi:osmotically inducible protein OsmC